MNFFTVVRRKLVHIWLIRIVRIYTNKFNHILFVFFLLCMIAQLENSCRLSRKTCARQERWQMDPWTWIVSYIIACTVYSVDLFLLRKYNIKWLENPSFLVRSSAELARPVINCTCCEEKLLLRLLRICVQIYMYTCNYNFYILEGNMRKHQ